MRALLRTVLVIGLLSIVGIVVFGYWTDAPWLKSMTSATAATNSTGAAADSAKQRGAELGKKAVAAAQEVSNTLDDAAVTAKIKAKMTLDDSVRARSVDVSTTGPTVTLTGTVRSATEHERVVRLARETEGVSQVVDHLVLQP